MFSNELFDSLYPDGIEHHYWTKARNKMVLSALKKLNVASKKIVEVGCGRGVVTKHLHEQGVDVQGFELANLPQYPGTEGYVHMGSDARHLPQEEREKFEVMLLLDVVEHIEEPEAFVRDLLSHFKNVKTLLITVPACQEIWSNFDTFNGHYRRYDMTMSQALLRAVSMRPLYSSYLYHSLYLVMRLLLIRKQNRSTRIQAPTQKNRFLHTLMCQLLLADCHFLPKKWKGSSLIIAGAYT